MDLNTKYLEKTIMNKIESYLYFIHGRDIGRNIFYSFTFKLEELYKVSEFDDENKANIAFNYVLPVISLYRALIENKMEKNKAIFFIKTYLSESNKKEIDSYLKLIKTPFYYSIFDRKIKKYQEKHFPIDVFKTKWIEFNNQRLYFDINKCIYMEILEEYGEMDLKDIFCEMEKNMFSKSVEKVDLQIPKKISLGDKSCEFRFLKKDAR